MTALVARPPLQPLSMSSAQSGTRRLTARLQDKHDAGPSANGVQAKSGINRKRKIDYEEEDDGFVFSRVKKPKPKTAQPDAQQSSTETSKGGTPKPQPSSDSVDGIQQSQAAEGRKEGQKKRPKLSFSTPRRPEPQPVRRSKRLSGENDNRDGSPERKPQRTAHHQQNDTVTKNSASDPKNGASPKKAVRVTEPENAQSPQIEEQQHVHKIALPFADTPVIRRNKAMREGKSSKGERRSSLGLRGRRASSLIESGNSNALPHGEVEICDFYKHIESKGLPEPRRMKQLLTWCATRVIDTKPIGTDFEDSSARSAARVIEEELLNDLSNKSELSDWFSRQDEPVSTVPLPERPNPKNLQNEGKLLELEDQIRRLRGQKEALEALLEPPPIEETPRFPNSIDAKALQVDRSLLSETDASLLDALNSNPDLPDNISKRLNSITTTLEPTVDIFADGINSIARYRDTADSLASRILAACAAKLSERDKESRRKALQQDEDRSPGRDLSSVLRSLSRIDR